MTKKVILASIMAIAMCALTLPANAQFGKALKNAGKSVTKAAKEVAGDMASDIAATKVSDKIVEFMDNNNNVVAEDSEYYKRLAYLVGKDYVSVDGLDLNYKVYENPEANILATANGNIRVYTGMMDLLEDDELLAVIAMQIGHIANKDTRDNLLKVATGGQAEKAGTAQLEKMLSFSGDKLGSIVNELIQVPYSDEQNQKADTYAYDLLKNKGANTGALSSVLAKFAQLEAADKEASESEDGELSAAAKFIGVNSNNSTRASLIRSK